MVTLVLGSVAWRLCIGADSRYVIHNLHTKVCILPARVRFPG